MIKKTFKIGPTPGNNPQERLDNLLRRNEIINAAARENPPKRLYNCNICNFWPCEYQVLVCDTCIAKYNSSPLESSASQAG